MLISVDIDSEVPLKRQISGEIRKAILRGDLKPGEVLPPASDLAASLAVNIHTVLDAYSILRRERLVEMRQGKRARIHPSARSIPEPVVEQAREFIETAQQFGLRSLEVVHLIEREWP